MSRKLLIAPFVVVIFLMVLAYVSYSGLSKQKVALDDIFNDRFKGYQASSKLLKDLSSIHANVYRVISWTSAKYEQNKIDQLIKEQVQAIDQIVESNKAILR